MRQEPNEDKPISKEDMKRNKWIAACLLLLAGTLLPDRAAAQWKVGVNAGYTYNHYSIDTHYAYDFNYDGRGGLTVGIPVEYGILDWLAVRADLSYLQKGYSMDRAYDQTCRDRRDHYLSLPVMARISFGSEKVRGFLHAGGYMGYWMKSRVKGVEQSVSSLLEDVFNDKDEGIFVAYDNEYTFNSTRDNRLDAGLVGGVGVCYRLCPRIELEAEGRCYYALTSIAKEYMKHTKQPQYNTTFALQVGVKYCF